VTSNVFRIIDTGIRGGRENIAFDAALIDERQAGRVPDTIRFLRFPPTALIGRHQDLSREVDLDYCRAHGIGVVRRITGGGAIYLDEGQLGWELVFHRASLGTPVLPDLAREICTAAARGLSEPGIDESFRPRNDIEVEGRKISGTGGFFDGDVLIYQGTVLVDLDPRQMVAALSIPQAKLAKRRLDSAAARVVTLRELLGADLPDIDTIRQALLRGFTEGLGIRAQPGSITAGEEAAADRYLADEIGTDEFVAEIDNPGGGAGVLAGSHTGPGGTIDTFVKLEGPGRRVVQRLLISGDFFVTPPRIVFDLEAHLAGVAVDEIDAAVDAFFRANDVDTLSVAPADFQASIAAALASPEARHV
jgi:lipoate---protein ligase